MILFKRVKIRSYEVGLYFRDGEFKGLLPAGRHWLFDPLWKVQRRRRLAARSVARAREARRDRQERCARRPRRGRRPEGLPARPRVDRRPLQPHPAAGPVRLLDGREGRARRDRRCAEGPLPARRLQGRSSARRTPRRCSTSARSSATTSACRSRTASTSRRCRRASTPSGGTSLTSKVVEVDLREQTLDVAGQEIMTADKVTLRMNAVVTYRIVDARQAVTVSDGATQSLYREAQLALRAVVGTRDLDTFLTDKDAVTSAFEEAVRRRAGELGLEIVSVGVRDIILPGEMKDLMNKVTEAKKAAEANLIVRREETAAMRSQANTAKLLADNPTLMRLRELEVLEKVATSGKLNVVLGEKGLADRVVNLL